MKAFTLIELIFVIVIFGIISMFGADLYTKIYNSYAHTRAVNQLEARTMNAISIISARLEDRIKGTVIARMSSDDTFVDVRSATENHDIIEWIGQSIESKNLVRTAAGGPGSSIGWSGYADVDSATDTTTGVAPLATASPANLTFTLNSQGSNLTNASQIIRRLRGNADATFGVIFRNIIATDVVQDAYGYNFNGTQLAEFVGTATGANEVITITLPVRTDSLGDPIAKISEQYHLAHSAYAIVPTNFTEPYNGPSGAKVADWNFDLALHYNYTPWNGGAYNDAVNTSTAIMVRDVSLFRFRNDNGAIALKLCLRDAGRNFDPEKLDLIVCKSQVVY